MDYQLPHQVIRDGEVLYGIEADSQSYVADAPLIYDSDKKLAAANTHPSAIAGFAIGAASGVGGTKQGFLYPKGARLSLSVWSATLANAKTAQSQVTGLYSMKIANGVAYVNLDDTSTAPILKVIEIDPLWPEGETYGKLICEIIPAGLQLETDRT